MDSSFVCWTVGLARCVICGASDVCRTVDFAECRVKVLVR